RGKARTEGVEKKHQVSLSDSATAAVQMTDTYNLGKAVYDKLLGRMEKFPEDPDYDVEEHIYSSDMILSKHERDWVRGKRPRSYEEGKQLLDTIQTGRERAEVAQVNPALSFLITMADPVYMLPAGVAIKAA